MPTHHRLPGLAAALAGVLVLVNAAFADAAFAQIAPPGTVAAAARDLPPPEHTPPPVPTQTPTPAPTVATQPAGAASRRSPFAGTLLFLGGGAAGLVVHESGHVITSLAFGARPSAGALRYGPIRFVAIRHRPVSRRQEFVISSSGFWMQHAGSEWLLTTRPRLRDESAPFEKGVLAFNLATSAVYSIAAFGHYGPPERDTLGVAEGLGRDGVAEGWAGVLILGPALLDGYRYLHPDARWPVWASRAMKVAGVALTIAAGRH